MFYHSLKLTYRNVRRFPGTFLINVLGLSSGLACSLFIYLWISDEVGVDKFHEHDAQLSQVVENQHNESGITTRQATPIGMAYVLAETMPEVEHAATVTPMGWFPKFVIEHNGEQVKSEGKFVGKDFLNMFSFGLAQGDKETVFKDMNSVVISEALAIKLFGAVTNATGKTIPWSLGDIKKESVISGILKPIPANSSEQFDMLFNIELLGQIMNMAKDDLSAPGPSTFLTLKPGADVESFKRKVNTLMLARTGNKQSEYFLTRFSDKYLYGQFERGVQTGGRIEYVKLFGVIGIIILLIACINFMNLSTAKASRRMKEVGIRKAVGALRSSLMTQFFGESILISFVSAAIALVLVILLLPAFNDITGKQLAIALTKENVLGFLGITLTTGILAGSYPALYLSGFKPALVLKGKIITSYSGQWVRSGLVVFQFVVSILFIVSVIVVYRQMSFIQDRNLGYDKNNLLYFEIEGNVATNHNAFVQEVKKIPGIVQASAMVGNVVGAFGNPQEMSFEGKKIPVNHLMIDYGMIETLGIPVKSGRAFGEAFNDADRVVINRAAADQMGAIDVIGKTIDFFGRKFEIIGITDNFHYRSLHEEITPLVFVLQTKQLMNIFVKLQGNRQEEAIQNLKILYKAFNPGYTFDYQFVDHAYQAQYAGERRVADLSLWFAGFAIIIAALGLIGLAAFTAEKRIKEIGIRKVLGATPAAIVYLLSAEFIKLILIAIVIALPISFYLTNEWLKRFAYSIDLKIWFFASSALIAILVSLATVGGQAIKASLVNPASCLKEE